MSSPKRGTAGPRAVLRVQHSAWPPTTQVLLYPQQVAHTSICPQCCPGLRASFPALSHGIQGLPFSFSSMQGAAPRAHRALTCWNSLGWFWAGHAGTCFLLLALGAPTRRLLGTLDAAVHCGIQPSDFGVEKVQVCESPGFSRFLLPSLALGVDRVSGLCSCPSCSNNPRWELTSDPRADACGCSRWIPHSQVMGTSWCHLVSFGPSAVARMLGEVRAAPHFGAQYKYFWLAQLQIPPLKAMFFSPIQHKHPSWANTWAAAPTASPSGAQASTTQCIIRLMS